MLLLVSQGTGYHVFTDRFYTGPQLCEELLRLGIHATGTVMINCKGLPQEMRSKRIKVHEVIAYQKDNKVMALQWKDKRIVSMCSTVYTADTKEVQRIVARDNLLTISKPVVILEYTKYMGAVDRVDQYCGSYAFLRKSVKWWRKMFFWLLEVAIVNSFMLYNEDRKQRSLRVVTHKTFRMALIEQLVGQVRNFNSGKRGRPSTQDTEDRLNGKPHFVMKNESNSTKDCAVCSNRKIKGQRRETAYFCETCPRKPGLHPGVCFKKFHTMKKYKN